MSIHPYTSSTSSLTQLANQLRKRFPQMLDAGTLKQYQIAPNNESTIINAFKFLEIINSDGSPNPNAKSLFLKSDDEFFNGLKEIIRKAYGGLFDLFADDSWSLGIEKLVNFFRQADETSDIIGNRQARTFVALSNYVGARDQNLDLTTGASPRKTQPRTTTSQTAGSENSRKTKKILTSESTESAKAGGSDFNNNSVSLSVRIEVNLPSGADQETYDAIFRSIRKNLMS